MAGMDKTVFFRVTDVKEQDAENYRYWASLTTAERMRASAELTIAGYRHKGVDVHVARADRADFCAKRTLR